MELEDGVPVVRVPLERLRLFCRSAVSAIGFSESEVELVTAALVTGSLRSHPGQGQGVQQLPRYLARVRAGVVRVHAGTRLLSSGPATAVMDADRAAGSVAASRAMDAAVALAQSQGVGAVAVRDSTHLGVASHYAMRALEGGCIGLAFTNAGPEIAPWGGTEAIVGTNPWAVALPTPEPWPIVLDMATSTSGKGMVRWFQEAGRRIPDDWALTTSGERTTDAAAALAGTLFPLGGAKGYAMAVIMDGLTGILAGAAFGGSCFGAEHQDVGHLLLALRIDRFSPMDDFLRRVGELIAQLRSSPLATGVERIWLPGELEYARVQERTQRGVPFDRSAHQGLEALARELGLDLGLLVPAQ